MPAAPPTERHLVLRRCVIRDERVLHFTARADRQARILQLLQVHRVQIGRTRFNVRQRDFVCASAAKRDLVLRRCVVRDERVLHFTARADRQARVLQLFKVHRIQIGRARFNVRQRDFVCASAAKRDLVLRRCVVRDERVLHFTARADRQARVLQLFKVHRVQIGRARFNVRQRDFVRASAAKRDLVLRRCVVRDERVLHFTARADRQARVLQLFKVHRVQIGRARFNIRQRDFVRASAAKRNLVLRRCVVRDERVLHFTARADRQTRVLQLLKVHRVQIGRTRFDIRQRDFVRASAAKRNLVLRRCVVRDERVLHFAARAYYQTGIFQLLQVDRILVHRTRLHVVNLRATRTFQRHRVFLRLVVVRDEGVRRDAGRCPSSGPRPSTASGSPRPRSTVPAATLWICVPLAPFRRDRGLGTGVIVLHGVIEAIVERGDRVADRVAAASSPTVYRRLSNRAGHRIRPPPRHPVHPPRCR